MGFVDLRNKTKLEDFFDSKIAGGLCTQKRKNFRNEEKKKKGKEIPDQRSTNSYFKRCCEVSSKTFARGFVSGFIRPLLKSGQYWMIENDFMSMPSQKGESTTTIKH